MTNKPDDEVRYSHNKPLLEIDEMYFVSNGHLYKKTDSNYIPGQFYFSVYVDSSAPTSLVFQIVRMNVQSFVDSDNIFKSGAAELFYFGSHELDFAFMYSSVVKRALIKLQQNSAKLKNISQNS